MRFLCKENMRKTLVSQGISLISFHNTFLYIRFACGLHSRFGNYIYGGSSSYDSLPSETVAVLLPICSEIIFLRFAHNAWGRCDLSADPFTG